MAVEPDVSQKEALTQLADLSEEKTEKYEHGTTVVIILKEKKRFEIKEASNGKPYFNLMATNGQVIGTSQMYANGVNMKNGIASVQKNAPEAEIVDLTEAK